MYSYHNLIIVGLTLCYYIADIQCKQGIIDNLLFSMTHIGQETRLLTKYFIPDHRKILAIQENINTFRGYIQGKKLERDQHKEFVERILEREEELDNTFVDEITKELDKDKGFDSNSNNKRN